MNYDYSKPNIGTYQIMLGNEWHEIEWVFLKDHGEFCAGCICGTSKTIEALLFYRPWSLNLYNNSDHVRYFCSIDMLMEMPPSWFMKMLGKIWPVFNKNKLYITYSEWPELFVALARKPMWQREGF